MTPELYRHAGVLEQRDAPSPGDLLAAVQIAAGALVLARLARGRRRREPLTVPPSPLRADVSAVVPARNEADRIRPCLQALTADPGYCEVIVVDDGSADATAQIAERFGARVIAAGEPPPGWVGKPWALQRGLQAARGRVVVSVDADTRPHQGLGQALAAALQDADLVTVGARFICDTSGERWLHPAMLMTLIYRFGPPDSRRPARHARLVVSGQCTAVRRDRLLAAGGYVHGAGHMTDDAAQARGLAGLGWRIVFRDSGGLLDVDMHESARELWREWGRSIALRDVTPLPWMIADLAVVWLVLGLPPLRIIAGRGTRVDAALLALRWVVSIPVAHSYTRRGAAYWLSALADPAIAVRLTLSAVRPSRRWRGRVYGA